ncbi:hypothetical protein TWF718_004481 [Orbilia javanica]|uniref:Antifreeze protein n=1 Tax=Orbilia javanica TaxID=47235 RepID=A0AAN8MXP2_9PEZI
MYLKSIILALGAASAVSATQLCVDSCNANNCLRALRATNIATRLSQASADCTRIVDVTYTPPASTITEYAAGPTTTITDLYDKRAVTSVGLPSYASDCASFYHFSSACSCIGVHPTIHTAPKPTVTVTLPAASTTVT